MKPVVVRADARSLPLATASVDLIVTSPPYFALRSYQDGGEHYEGQVGDEATPTEFVDALIDCTREWLRVLKPSGSIWVNLGDKYAQDTERSRNGNGNRRKTDTPLVGRADMLSEGRPTFYGGKPLRGPTVTLGRKDNGVPRKSLIGIPWRYALRCIDELGMILRAEVIWSKPNGLPESVTDRVRRSHEQWFHFTLRPRYFSGEVHEPHSTSQRPGCLTWEQRRDRDDKAARDQNGHGGTAGMARSPLGKLPGSVWTVPTEPLRVPDRLGLDHFAAFPTEFPRRIIAGWAPPGGIVLDPFGGTGTTALVAAALERQGISVDLSHDYCRLARWRVTDPGERARARRVPKPAPVPDGQGDLFGEAS